MLTSDNHQSQAKLKTDRRVLEADTKQNIFDHIPFPGSTIRRSEAGSTEFSAMRVDICSQLARGLGMDPNYEIAVMWFEGAAVQGP